MYYKKLNFCGEYTPLTPSPLFREGFMQNGSESYAQCRLKATLVIAAKMAAAEKGSEKKEV